MFEPTKGAHIRYVLDIQEENTSTEGGGAQYNNQRGFNQGNRGNFGRG
jgi:hypothetical protein